MTSSALLARVAESIVIFAPIFHVGWRSASSGPTRSSSPRSSPRKGPPEAVSTRRANRPGVLARQTLENGRVLAVDRDQLSTTFAGRFDHQGPSRHE